MGTLLLLKQVGLSKLPLACNGSACFDSHLLFSDGIEDLTGGLSTFFVSEDIVDLDKFWDEGLAQVNKSFLWGGSTAKVNEQDCQGLAGPHAYSILEARTIPGGIRLLKVRNPWGMTEWDGDWSDRSKKWTDELKKLLKHQDKDDGVFWISYEDLLRNYPHLHRTRIFDDSWTVAQIWTNFTVPLLSSDTYERTFKFTLTKAATTAVVLSQLDERYYRGLKGQYEFGLSFRLHKLNEDDYLYRCHYRHFDDRSINLEVDLEAGVYEVRLKITGLRYEERPKIEDVVRINWKNSREKLLQICRSYDLAHAKVAAPELQMSEVEPKGSLKQPDASLKPVDEVPEVKREIQGVDKTEEPQPDVMTGESAENTKGDAKEGKSDHQSGENEERFKDNGTLETETKLNMSQSIQSMPDSKSKSSVEVTNQDGSSDTGTTSTEPEIIEKSDFKPEAENGGSETNTKSNVDGKKPGLKDETAQLGSMYDQPPGGTPSKALPSPSTARTDGSTESASGGSMADQTTSVSEPIQIEEDERNSKITNDGKDQGTPQTADNTDDKASQPTTNDNEAPPPLSPTEKPVENDQKEDNPAPFGDEADKEEAEVEAEEDDRHKPSEPFNSVCTVGLRVYCKNAEARIELIRESTALVQDKQFTSSKECEMDVDDPAKS